MGCCDTGGLARIRLENKVYDQHYTIQGKYVLCVSA